MSWPAGLLAAWFFALALPATAASPFVDPTGDTPGADVTTVTVGNDRDNLTVEVRFANRPELAAGDTVLVDLDADNSRASGEEGIDFYAAFGGEAELSFFEWKDGAFAESTSAKVAFGNGTATLVVPLSFVKSTVAVSVLAVSGQDPGVSPTDRAPDSGAWTYAVARPAFQKAAVRFSPAKPRAGKSFAVGSVSLTFTVVGTITADDLTCDATLARKALSETDTCRWKLPKNAKGKRLTVTIEASSAGETYRLPAQRFTVR